MSQPNLANASLSDIGSNASVSSQPSMVAGGPAVKQPTNVYTMMLILSFIALLTGSVLLYLELQRFGSYPWWSTTSAQPSVGS